MLPVSGQCKITDASFAWPISRVPCARWYRMECFLQNFASEIVNAFSRGGNHRAFARHRLLYKSRLARTTTDLIESLRAAFRMRLLDEASAEFLVDRARKQPQTEFLAKSTLGKLQQATQTQPDGVDPLKHTNGHVVGPWTAFVRSVSMGSGRLADARSCSRQHAARSVGEAAFRARQRGW